MLPKELKGLRLFWSILILNFSHTFFILSDALDEHSSNVGVIFLSNVLTTLSISKSKFEFLSNVLTNLSKLCFVLSKI
jgi:hypothetical protein